MDCVMKIAIIMNATMIMANVRHALMGVICIF